MESSKDGIRKKLESLKGQFIGLYYVVEPQGAPESLMGILKEVTDDMIVILGVDEITVSVRMISIVKFTNRPAIDTLEWVKSLIDQARV